MKTAISVPDPIFEEAEDLAKRLGMSRSQLYATALTRFLEVHNDEAVTQALNEVYAGEETGVDPVLMQMQVQTAVSATDAEEWS